MRKEYHKLWYLQIKEKATPFLYWLKQTTVEQILEQVEVSRETNSFLLDWQTFVGNSHTLPQFEKPIEKLAQIHDVLQNITKLVLPNWIMDRFKEALDQNVRGEWFSSISLCGDIVEFITNDLWDAYEEEMVKKKLTRTSRVRKNLKRLQNAGVLKDDDFKRLFFVRQKRDDHVHDYLRNKLMGDYSEQVKSDSAEALKKLCDFFSEDNIAHSYSKYLDYASEQFSQSKRK